MYYKVYVLSHDGALINEVLFDEYDDEDWSLDNLGNAYCYATWKYWVDSDQYLKLVYRDGYHAIIYKLAKKRKKQDYVYICLMEDSYSHEDTYALCQLEREYIREHGLIVRNDWPC